MALPRLTPGIVQSNCLKLLYSKVQMFDKLCGMRSDFHYYLCRQLNGGGMEIYMKQEEFRKKIFVLTEVEKQLKNGNLSNSDFIRTLWKAEKDADGNYYVQNKKEILSPDNSNLRIPTSYAASENELQLMIHTRFAELPFHHDEFISVNYVYSGKLIVRFPDREIILTKGMLILMNSNIVHSLKVMNEDDIILGFQFNKEYMNKNLLYGLNGSGPVFDFLFKSIFGSSEKSNFKYKIFDYNNDEKMIHIFEEIFCEYLEPALCGTALIRNYLRIFLIYLIRSSNEQMTDFSDNNITEMLYYIEEHSRDCTLKSLAEEFNFNPKYISFLLKAKTGKSFTELQTSARMKLVCYLLSNTNKPIQEIAVTCGYSNQSFFYQKFQEIFHVTPKDYRKNK